jgi:hypothetical protein
VRPAIRAIRLPEPLAARSSSPRCTERGCYATLVGSLGRLHKGCAEERPPRRTVSAFRATRRSHLCSSQGICTSPRFERTIRNWGSPEFGVRLPSIGAFRPRKSHGGSRVRRLLSWPHQRVRRRGLRARIASWLSSTTGLTRRCSGLATLAAELHFVRPHPQHHHGKVGIEVD